MLSITTFIYIQHLLSFLHVKAVTNGNPMLYEAAFTIRQIFMNKFATNRKLGKSHCKKSCVNFY